MNELQERLLEMAKQFHEFCKKNGLTYYMIGGTQLGAVRHQGFIPWDDDMDFGMPREDYNKLLKLKDEAVDFEINEYTVTDDFEYAFAKIYNPNTTFIEDVGRKKKMIGGIFIDVFPIDGIGNDYKAALKVFKRFKIRKRLYWGALEGENTTSVIKNIVAKLLANYNKSKMLNFAYKTLDKYNYRESKYVLNAFGVANEKEIVEKRLFGNPVQYKFEDAYLYGVECPDEFLTNFYGDYMKLPPLEKRQKHNISYVDFNTPYKDYIAKE